MYAHPSDGYQLDGFLVDYLDGSAPQFCTRERAMNILAVFYPDPVDLSRRIAQGEVLPIHFGGMEARFVHTAFAGRLAVAVGADRSAARTAPRGRSLKAVK